ncbi:hypothetical protein G6F57_023287 [Rhizopus arrhizus]|nr:hypothetical protein G6F57_023287 [Rhizopus arrhizus]
MAEGRPVDSPGVPRSTMKAEIPLAPGASGSVRAMTVNRPASGALVMKHFSPFNTKLSPSRTAVVRSAVASDPACGSVSAKHPVNSPDAIRGR